MKILIVTDNLYQNLVDLIKLLLIHIKFYQKILILKLGWFLIEMQILKKN